MKPIQIKKDDGVDVDEVSNTASIQNLSTDKALVDVEAYGVNPVDSEFVKETYNKSFDSNFHPWEWNFSYFITQDKIQVRS